MVWINNFIPNHYNDTERTPMNQQEYAEKAYKLIVRDLLPSAPINVIVSYGFPKGRGSKNEKRIGECFSNPTPEGIASVIFLHPCQWTNPLDVLHVLAHEACHAATPGDGHKAKFGALARSIGLEGKLTATTPGEKLAQRLNAIAYELGDFPQAAFDYSDQKKQSTRLRLYQCACDPAEAKEEGRSTKIRCASDAMDMTCNVCEAKFEIQEAKDES